MTQTQFWQAMTINAMLFRKYGRRLTNMEAVDPTQGEPLPVRVTYVEGEPPVPKQKVFTLNNGQLEEVVNGG